MLSHGVTTLARERPYNNLLRRLNPADYALISPYISEDEAVSNDLLVLDIFFEKSLQGRL